MFVLNNIAKKITATNRLGNAVEIVPGKGCCLFLSLVQMMKRNKQLAFNKPKKCCKKTK